MSTNVSLRNFFFCHFFLGYHKKVITVAIVFITVILLQSRPFFEMVIDVNKTAIENGKFAATLL